MDRQNIRDLQERIAQLEDEGYSCGDCNHFDACRSLGVTKYGFLCYNFRNGGVTEIKGQE